MVALGASVICSELAVNRIDSFEHRFRSTGVTQLLQKIISEMEARRPLESSRFSLPVGCSYSDMVVSRGICPSFDRPSYSSRDRESEFLPR